MRLVLLLLLSFNTFASFYHVKGAHKYKKLLIKSKYKVAIHYWKTANHLPSKLIFFVHGYGDNCAYVKPMHRWFIKNNFDVLCMELPGHGESSGNRADIKSFQDYGKTLKDVLASINLRNYNKTYFIGHSTGNVGVTQLLMEDESLPFDKVIMVAPLIRSYKWNLSIKTYKAFGKYLEHIPRRNMYKNTPEYIQLKKLDPAPITKLPTNWFGELIKWNDSLSKTSPVNAEVFSIFGMEDKVIDWNFNSSFYAQLFPNGHVKLIEDAGHVFHYEKKEIKKSFFDILLNILD